MLTRRAVVVSAGGMPGPCRIVASGRGADAEKLKVVATFSILGDMVRNVGGERVEVTTLVGPNGDAHVYSPTPADAAPADAKPDRLHQRPEVRGLDRPPRQILRHQGRDDRGGERREDAERRRGRPRTTAMAASDPHAWQSIGNAKIYVAQYPRCPDRGRSEAGKATYEANAAAYLASSTRSRPRSGASSPAFPTERRRIITSHDAFRYFEDCLRHRLRRAAGRLHRSEASAKDVARIIQQIRREKITAVFVENVSDARLMERIAQETGARIGAQVYSDALSEPGGPAGTYIDMMRHNIRAFSAALSS